NLPSLTRRRAAEEMIRVGALRRRTAACLSAVHPGRRAVGKRGDRSVAAPSDLLELLELRASRTWPAEHTRAIAGDLKESILIPERRGGGVGLHAPGRGLEPELLVAVDGEVPGVRVVGVIAAIFVVVDLGQRRVAAIRVEFRPRIRRKEFWRRKLGVA